MHDAPARSLLRLGPRSWAFAPAFRKSKLANAAVCPVRTAFGPLRCRMAFRGAGGTQEGKARPIFFEGNAITFLISRTALRGFFGILTAHRGTFFSPLEGILRPEVLASIGLSLARYQIPDALRCIILDIRHWGCPARPWGTGIGKGIGIGPQAARSANRFYGWTGQQPGSGFFNLAPSILHYNWF
jgi:hypothetical protein